MATAEEFFAIDIRVGTVVHAEPFAETRMPSIKLMIDSGPEVGTKQTQPEVALLAVERAVPARTRIG